jgi:hypothetical protein
MQVLKICKLQLDQQLLADNFLLSVPSYIKSPRSFPSVDIVIFGFIKVLVLIFIYLKWTNAQFDI